ncbi:MAG: cell division protein FtsW, partial [Balneolaceae bacterium]
MLYTTPHSATGPGIPGASSEEMDTRSRGSDRILLTAVIMLMIFGVLAVYSSIAYFAGTRGTTAGSLVTGHMVKLGIAFIMLLIAS